MTHDTRLERLREVLRSEKMIDAYSVGAGVLLVLLCAQWWQS